MRRAHILKRNHHTYLPQKVIFVDTEADIQKAGRQRLRFGVAIYQEQGEEKERIRFIRAREFWEWVDRKIGWNETVWVLAHNWNYDAGVLNTSVELLRLHFELTQYINGKPPLIVKWRQSRGKQARRLVMVDTLNYFTSSVAMLGKAIGHEKLEMPRPDAARVDWDAYAWRDVEIIQRAFNLLAGFVEDSDLGNFQYTLASQAMSAYRHRFMTQDILIHDNEFACNLEREAYHGGRTESFWRGVVNQRLYKLDINSMYPAAMSHLELPHHYRMCMARYSERWFQRMRSENCAIIARVRVRTNQACYPAKDGAGRLIFPVGEFWTTLTSGELDYALAEDHVQEIGAWAAYDRGVLFEDFVNYFYRARQTFRGAGNFAFDFMAKILMNSLSGKFGQNGRKWVGDNLHHWGHLAPGYLECDGSCGRCAPGTIHHLRSRLGQTQVFTKEGEAENSFPAIAAEITGYCRIWLWKLIREAGEENVYYVDTDSLIVNDDGFQRLSHHLDANRLGALKLEEETGYAEFYGPKDYTFGETTKIKGVRKSDRHRDGIYTQDKFRSWDYIISQGQDGFIDVVEETKHVTGANAKRVMPGEGPGWTTPIIKTL